jgi:AcrR family transcriptional regulator
MSREAPEQEATRHEAKARGDVHSAATNLPETRQTRERLLDAALALFAERGFEATTTKLIAERAGVPNGLIYYYFGTKEKLLECLLGERTFLPDLQARVTEARANRDADPRLTLIEICTEFHAALRRNKPFARIISREAHLRPVASNLVRQLADQVLALIEAFLEDAQQQGKLRSLDTEMVAHALFSSLMMGALLWEFDAPRRSIERLVEVLLGGTG